MATKINLLPWRELARKERQRQFGSIAVGAAALMAAVLFYVHVHMTGKIDYQNDRNAYLESEIAVVDEKIKEIQELEKEKKQLLARMNVIQDLQGRRPLIVRMVDELVRVIPEGLYLTSLTQAGNGLTLSGEAQSNARISAFMRALDDSEWFSNPQLTVINSLVEGTNRSSRFVLQVQQVVPSTETEEGT